MTSTVSFRQAEQSDLMLIMEIEGESFGNEAFTKSQFQYLLKSPTAHFAVVTVNQTIAGYIILIYRKSGISIRIYSIAIAKEFRGKGIGMALLNYAKRMAKIMQRNTISLEVKESNTTAIELYKKAGFLSRDVRKDYYGLFEHGIIMRYSPPKPA